MYKRNVPVKEFPQTFIAQPKLTDKLNSAREARIAYLLEEDKDNPSEESLRVIMRKWKYLSLQEAESKNTIDEMLNAYYNSPEESEAQALLLRKIINLLEESGDQYEYQRNQLAMIEEFNLQRKTIENLL